MDSNPIISQTDSTNELSAVCERGAFFSVEKLLRRDGVAVSLQHGHRAGAAAEHIQEAAVAVGHQVGSPLETVYIGCPEQALVLARSGDHGDYENIFVRKIVLVL